jgi:putative transposase
MISRRRLPHLYRKDAWLFVTWHLHGSLPHGRFPPPAKASAGEVFVWIDRYLDLARHGPVFLRQDAIARLVETSPSILLRSLKGHTAREANRVLGRTGEPFWQRESYDHWVRSSGEFSRIVTYIENNPLKAGLVHRAEEYLWSSGNPKWRERLDRQAFT